MPSVQHTDSSTHSVISFLRRPQLLSSFQWNSSAERSTNIFRPAGRAEGLLVPSGLFRNRAMISRKLDGFTSFRATCVLKLQINAQPFQCGRLLMAAAPMPGLLGNRKEFIFSHVSNAQNLNHVQMDIAKDTEVELRIPFISPYNSYDLIDGKFDWAEVRVLVYSKLNAIESTCLQCLVYGHFEDIEMGAPTSGGVKQQSLMPNVSDVDKAKREEATGKFTGALAQLGSSLISSGLNVAKPLLAPIDSAMAALGWSKPILAKPSRIFINRPTEGFQYMDGVDQSLMLGITSSNAIEPIKGLVGTNIDETSFDTLKRIPQMIGAFSYGNDIITCGSSGDPVRLWDCAVSPSCNIPACYYVRPTSSDINVRNPYGLSWKQPTTLNYITSPFLYWKGSLVYTFKFVKTNYHSGRVEISYHPFVNVVDETRMDFVYRAVIDLRDNSEISLTVPYIAAQPYKRISTYLDPVNPNPPAPGRLKDIISGILYVRALTPLICATQIIANKIEVLVEMRAGDDFEVAAPVTSKFLPFSFQNPDATASPRQQSGEVIVADITPNAVWRNYKEMNYIAYTSAYTSNFNNEGKTILELDFENSAKYKYLILDVQCMKIGNPSHGCMAFFSDLPAIGGLMLVSRNTGISHYRFEGLQTSIPAKIRFFFEIREGDIDFAVAVSANVKEVTPQRPALLDENPVQQSGKILESQPIYTNTFTGNPLSSVVVVNLAQEYSKVYVSLSSLMMRNGTDFNPGSIARISCSELNYSVIVMYPYTHFAGVQNSYVNLYLDVLPKTLTFKFEILAGNASTTLGLNILVQESVSLPIALEGGGTVGVKIDQSQIPLPIQHPDVYSVQIDESQFPLRVQSEGLSNIVSINPEQLPLAVEGNLVGGEVSIAKKQLPLWTSIYNIAPENARPVQQSQLAMAGVTETRTRAMEGWMPPSITGSAQDAHRPKLTNLCIGENFSSFRQYSRRFAFAMVTGLDSMQMKQIQPVELIRPGSLCLRPTVDSTGNNERTQLCLYALNSKAELSGSPLAFVAGMYAFYRGSVRVKVWTDPRENPPNLLSGHLEYSRQIVDTNIINDNVENFMTPIAYETPLTKQLPEFQVPYYSPTIVSSTWSHGVDNQFDIPLVNLVLSIPDFRQTTTVFPMKVAIAAGDDMDFHQFIGPPPVINVGDLTIENRVIHYPPTGFTPTQKIALDVPANRRTELPASNFIPVSYTNLTMIPNITGGSCPPNPVSGVRLKREINKNINMEGIDTVDNKQSVSVPCPCHSLSDYEYE